MKNIIAIVVLLAITFFNISFAISNDSEITPIPEVVACESQGTCEMTSLAVLLQLDQAQEVTMEQLTIDGTQKKMINQ